MKIVQEEYKPHITGTMRILVGGYIIMQTIGAVLISLFLTGMIGCASTPTDKGLKSQISQFERIFNVQLTYPVYFKEFSKEDNGMKKGTILGQCSKIYGIPMYVQLSPRGWASLSKEQRNLLLYHELAHCSLHLEHKNDKFKDGCPVYAMNAYMPTNYCIRRHGLSYYINSIRRQNSYSYRRRR